MGRRERYELVFVHTDSLVTEPVSAAEPAPAPAEEDEDVVVVRRTDRSGPGGHPVYADETGIVQAEISDREEVRMIASGGHQDLASAVQVRPVA